MTRPIAYVDAKWPEMWAAFIKGAGIEQRPVGAPLEEGRPAVIRGLQYGAEVMLAECMAKSHPFYFIDSGYFRAFDQLPRLYYRVVKNSFHQNTVIKRDNGERWRALGLEMKPWRTRGNRILLCPPASEIVRDLFWGHGWATNAIRQINRYTDRQVVIRPKYSSGTIVDAGRGAWAVVTHLSNVAVDLAVEGIPAFVSNGNPAQPIADMDLSRIERPSMPDRQEWAESLACAQFTVEEMASGLAWEMMQC